MNEHNALPDDVARLNGMDLDDVNWVLALDFEVCKLHNERILKALNLPVHLTDNEPIDADKSILK